ncbi:MAG: hypothetical protein JXM79_18560 [Sedimentisphaerales bacterium]|nr:hypothetical protein [Sedimentisphaerales bacterium]
MKTKIEPLSLLLGLVIGILIFLLGASVAQTPTTGRYQLQALQNGKMVWILDTQTSELWFRHEFGDGESAYGWGTGYLGTTKNPIFRSESVNVIQHPNNP